MTVTLEPPGSVRTRDPRELLNAVRPMENPGADIGPGYTVDIGIHQIILDTPVYFAFCELYNGGRYKHHAPLVERRGDGTVMRTADIIRANGFEVDLELWEVDAAACGPCAAPPAGAAHHCPTHARRNPVARCSA